MKKTRILAATLAIATALAGTGYAYWTSDLKINSTVTSGTLNVKFDNTTVTKVLDAQRNNEEVAIVENTTRDGLVIDKTKEISFDIKNMYPGSYIDVNTFIKNDGSVKARFSGASVQIDGGGTLRNALLINDLAIVIYRYDEATHKYIPITTAEDNARKISSCTLAQLGDELNKVLKGVELQPKDIAILRQANAPDSAGAELSFAQAGSKMRITLPAEVTDATLQGQTMKVDISLNWNQLNDSSTRK